MLRFSFAIIPNDRHNTHAHTLQQLLLVGCHNIEHVTVSGDLIHCLYSHYTMGQWVRLICLGTGSSNIIYRLASPVLCHWTAAIIACRKPRQPMVCVYWLTSCSCHCNVVHHVPCMSGGLQVVKLVWQTGFFFLKNNYLVSLSWDIILWHVHNCLYIILLKYYAMLSIIERLFFSWLDKMV